jgi:hypothetical protein
VGAVAIDRDAKSSVISAATKRNPKLKILSHSSSSLPVLLLIQRRIQAKANSGQMQFNWAAIAPQLLLGLNNRPLQNSAFNPSVREQMESAVLYLIATGNAASDRA